MGCQDPSEDVEDDGMEFLAAAQEDDDVVARILIRLSHSATPSSPPQPTSSSPATEGVYRPLLPPETRWGGRRTRSRSITMEGILAAKREDAAAAGRLASPATPLSWSGGSGSSGSVCGEGWLAPSRPTKRRGEPSSREHGESREPRQEAELCYGGERIRAPPSQRLTVESHGSGDPHGDSVVGARASAAAVAVFSGYGSKNTAVEVAMGGPETSRMPPEVELQRLGWTGSGSVGFRRPGKKKTVAELHALQESLLQENEELKKELLKHKEVYHALLEENMKLKMESRLASHMASKRSAAYVSCEAAASSECRQRVESASESQTVDEPSTVSIVPEEDRCERLPCASSPISAPGRALPFDLNRLPDEDV